MHFYKTLMSFTQKILKHAVTEKDRKTAILKYKKKNYFPYTKYQLYLIFSSSSLHFDSTSDDDVIRYRILEKGSKRGGRLLVASTGYTYGLKVVTL